MTELFEPTPQRRKVLWAAAIEDLKTECPLLFPVTVRRVPLSDLASCDLLDSGDKHRFAISIHRDAGFQYQLYLLVHEWAHAMTWMMVDNPGTDHCELWGVAFSKAYQAVIHD